MNPRLLYLLTVGRARRDLAERRAGRVGTYVPDPLAYHDQVDLDLAEWSGYGRHSVGTMLVRTGH